MNRVPLLALLSSLALAAGCTSPQPSSPDIKVQFRTSSPSALKQKLKQEPLLSQTPSVAPLPKNERMGLKERIAEENKEIIQREELKPTVRVEPLDPPGERVQYLGENYLVAKEPLHLQEKGDYLLRGIVSKENQPLQLEIVFSFTPEKNSSYLKASLDLTSDPQEPFSLEYSLFPEGARKLEKIIWFDSGGKVYLFQNGVEGYLQNSCGHSWSGPEKFSCGEITALVFRAEQARKKYEQLFGVEEQVKAIQKNQLK